MTNHVHLIAIPGREDSLAVLFRRVHGRYAQYYNARSGRTGHLWQNRFFACGLSTSHLWRALAYVDQNPVRAGLVTRADEYKWSSAMAHLAGADEFQLLDMQWWEVSGFQNEWSTFLGREDAGEVAALRASTYAGRPFGEEAFMAEVGAQFGRQWKRGRPRKDELLQKTRIAITAKERVQFSLFDSKNPADQAVPLFPPFWVTATGVPGGSAPTLTASPSRLQFGVVCRDERAAKVLMLSNSGMTTITNLNVTLEGENQSGPNHFNLENKCRETLAAGASCRVRVFLDADKVGVATGTIHIGYSGAGSPQMVPLSATVVDQEHDR